MGMGIRLTLGYIVFIIITLLLAYACGPGPDAPSKERRLLDFEQWLYDEIAKSETSPCNTALRFEKKSSGWVLTCPGCSWLPADSFFPQRIINQIELEAIGGKLTLTQVGRITGDCP